jgi:hypothetical protein
VRTDRTVQPTKTLSGAVQRPGGPEGSGHALCKFSVIEDAPIQSQMDVPGFSRNERKPVLLPRAKEIRFNLLDPISKYLACAASVQARSSVPASYS